MKPDPSKSSDHIGLNGGAKQKINSQKAHQKRNLTTSTSYYAPVPTTIPPNVSSLSFETTELLSYSRPMVPGQSMAPPGSNKRAENCKVAPAAEKSVTTPMSTRSLDLGDGKISSPSSAYSNGPKKNIKDTMSRTVSNLSHAPSSVATTNFGAASKIESSKTGAKKRAVEKRYYAKAIGLMSVGGFIFAVGIALAALHFAHYDVIMMSGPITISIGLLLLVCGIVWMPIISTKLKRKQQIMSRTFSL